MATGINLGKLANLLFRGASMINTLNIILSMNPRRIMRHFARKRVTRLSGRASKKVFKP